LCSLEQKGETPDVVVGQVAQALRSGGHRVSILAAHGDARHLLAGLQRRKPELVFNLTEQFGTNVFGDIGVAGMLDLLGLAYTGCGPGELYLAQDKVLGKKLLAFEGIGYPRFAVFSREAELESGGNLHMPLFVKPARCDASIGIETGSLCHDAKEMMRRISLIHDKIRDDALVEEFVEGREFYVGVLGNHQPHALPVIEMDFSHMPKGAPHILDQKAKFDVDSAVYKGSRPVLAELPDETRARMHKLALDAYRALRVRDYGRVDFRMTETGELYVLEVNAGCYLEQHDEFPQAAQAAGIGYDALILRIVELAMERHRR
jgi:D-alanine-D-alanine ligase